MSAELKGLKLYYFAEVNGSTTMGRGEFVKLLLEDAGLEHEYERVTFEQWGEKKQELIKQKVPSPTLPYITIGDKYYGKTVPIMRFIAKKLGKYNGSNDDEEQVLDAHADTVMDWAYRWASAVFGKSEEALKTYEQTHRINSHAAIETILASSNGPYVLGEKITYVDFLIYHMTDDDVQGAVDSQKYPNLQKLLDAIKARPSLKKHFDSLK
ncbi:glutathione S-transferase [Sporodiniella umbellata]|nr:glutathione S-transferase [Sporodiniella umbellata]